MTETNKFFTRSVIQKLSSNTMRDFVNITDNKQTNNDIVKVGESGGDIFRASLNDNMTIRSYLNLFLRRSFFIKIYGNSKKKTF